MWSRRAPSPTSRPAKGWRSWTARWRSPTRLWTRPRRTGLAQFPTDSAFQRGAGTFGKHHQPVELTPRQLVGPVAFLRGRAGVGSYPKQTLRTGQACLLVFGESGAAQPDRLGFGDVERGDVLLH